MDSFWLGDDGEVAAMIHDSSDPWNPPSRSHILHEQIERLW